MHVRDLVHIQQRIIIAKAQVKFQPNWFIDFSSKGEESEKNIYYA